MTRDFFRPAFLAGLLFGLMVCAGQAYAQVPRVLNYQGRLASDGIPANGTFSVTFSIYTTPSGGSALWTETQNVTVTEGILSTLLGTVSPFPADFFTGTSALYLGISVQGGAELQPRLFLTSTAYAFKAESADAVADEAITTASLADGAVTRAKIADDAAVKTLNGFAGNVTISAGSNVSISQSNGTLTISSVGGSGGGGGDITAVETTGGLEGGAEAGDVSLAIADEGVTTAKLAAESVTSAKLAPLAVTNAKIADGAISTAKLADGSVTVQKLSGVGLVSSLNGATGAVTLEAAGGASINRSGNTITITAGSGSGSSGIQGIQNTDNALVVNNSNGPTTTINVRSQGIQRGMIDDDAVVKSLNGMTNTVRIAAGSGLQLAEDDDQGLITLSATGGGGAGDVTSVRTLAGSGLAGGAESGDVSLSLADNGVTTAKIANLAVSTDKIANDAITAQKIAELGVTTANLANGAVTAEKIAATGAVKTLNAQTGAVTLQAGNNITITNPSAGTIRIEATGAGSGDITAITTAAGSGLSGGVDTGAASLAIAENGVTTARIADGAVTAGKIADNAAVKSLNGQTGSVVLQAGANVTLTPGAGTLTIAATGGGAGDITSVAAGAGLTGGGTTGDVTLTLDPDAVVSSVNGSAGSISISGGTDIDVQTSGSTVTVNYAPASSQRWKTNIAPIENALGLIERLQGVRYEWKESGKEAIGLIAEEVGKIVPEVVTYEENGVDARSIDYPKLVAVLIEAMKTQQQQIDSQNQTMLDLLKRIERLEAGTAQAARSTTN